MEVNIRQVKTHLSCLLERVAVGEEVVIVKAGKPVAKLVPIKSSRPKFKFGSAKGEFAVPDVWISVAACRKLSRRSKLAN
jgi:prevent-host-death family protein